MLISAVQPAQVSEIGSDAIYSLCISETIKTILAIVVNVAYKLSIKAHTWLCYFVELKSVQDMMNRSKSVHQITLLEVYRCVSHLHWSNSNAVLWLRKKYAYTQNRGKTYVSGLYRAYMCNRIRYKCDLFLHCTLSSVVNVRKMHLSNSDKCVKTN